MSFVATLLDALTRRVVDVRAPDFVIRGLHDDSVYLVRWWVIPRNRFFNIYLHHFLRSDDDRALHDHPWSNCSLLLKGSYTEHAIDAGGIHQRTVLSAGAVRMRWSGRFAHRVELHNGPCWTLFITGPVVRKWGFHCPQKGWVLHSDFSKSVDSQPRGRGCD